MASKGASANMGARRREETEGAEEGRRELEEKKGGRRGEKRRGRRSGRNKEDRYHVKQHIPWCLGLEFRVFGGHCSIYH